MAGGFAGQRPAPSSAFGLVACPPFGHPDEERRPEDRNSSGTLITRCDGPEKAFLRFNKGVVNIILDYFRSRPRLFREFTIVPAAGTLTGPNGPGAARRYRDRPQVRRPDRALQGRPRIHASMFGPR